jgi:hypothetical protein
VLLWSLVGFVVVLWAIKVSFAFGAKFDDHSLTEVEYQLFSIPSGTLRGYSMGTCRIIRFSLLTREATLVVKMTNLSNCGHPGNLRGPSPWVLASARQY